MKLRKVDRFSLGLGFSFAVYTVGWMLLFVSIFNFLTNTMSNLVHKFIFGILFFILSYDIFLELTHFLLIKYLEIKQVKEK